MTTHEQRLYAAQEKLLTRIEQLEAERQQLQEELRKCELVRDSLIAERQQAQEELASATIACNVAVTQAEKARKAERSGRKEAEKRRQQAIDALREHMEFVTAHTLVEAGVTDFDLQNETVERLRDASELPTVKATIRAALEKLGE